MLSLNIYQECATTPKRRSLALRNHFGSCLKTWCWSPIFTTRLHRQFVNGQRVCASTSCTVGGLLLELTVSALSTSLQQIQLDPWDKKTDSIRTEFSTCSNQRVFEKMFFLEKSCIKACFCAAVCSVSCITSQFFASHVVCGRKWQWCWRSDHVQALESPTSHKLISGKAIRGRPPGFRSPRTTASTDDELQG